MIYFVYLQSFALHLSQQVQFFSVVQQRLVKQLGADAGMKQLSKSIFVVVIGSNDIINYFKSDSKLQKTKAPQQYVDEMVTTLQGQVKVHFLHPSLRLRPNQVTLV